VPAVSIMAKWRSPEFRMNANPPTGASSPIAIILAAGKGTRMKSDLPKVVHPVGGRPMVCAVVDACVAVGCSRVVAVVGHMQEKVREALASYGARIAFAVQQPQLGTGHAVQCAREAMGAFAPTTDVLVLCGDGPLIRPETLRELLDRHRSARAAATLATAIIDDPTGYGRIDRDAQGRFRAIVEHKHATESQRAIREVNPSYYCFQAGPLFAALGEVKRTNVFPDGEILVKLDEDVRGRDCYVVLSTCEPVNDNLMELLIFIDCLARQRARVTVVMPYFGYARQDRKDEGRVPITAKLVANLITAAGADRVLAIDLHAAQIQGFFDLPVDHLSATPGLRDYFQPRSEGTWRPVPREPDVGNVKVAEGMANLLGGDLAIINKRALGSDGRQTGNLIGTVEGQDGADVRRHDLDRGHGLRGRQARDGQGRPRRSSPPRRTACWWAGSWRARSARWSSPIPFRPTAGSRPFAPSSLSSALVSCWARRFTGSTTICLSVRCFATRPA
jgi:CTP:molybdopterin cytidylyltransferase MocA